MSDRPYPKILRTTDAADATLRTYARGAHLAPFEALILAIGLLRTKDEREAASEYNAAALDVVRADLESAREATRRADAEVERLTRELAEVRAAIETKGAPDKLAERVETIAADVDRRACACALPDDLAPRLAAIAARRDVEPHVMLANVIKNGISKIQASDEYQDRQKAARKARS